MFPKRGDSAIVFVYANIQQVNCITMKLKSIFSNVFNIKKGEGTSIVLLMTYSLFMGAAIAFFYTSSTSLLLVNFEREMLAYAYIIGGIFVYCLSSFYSRLQKIFKISNILILGIGFLLVTVAVLLFSYISTGNKWITFILFIWIRVIAFIHGVSFWGVAQRIFDLRQGKRLFGLIGSGENISYIIGFFSTPLLLRFIATDDLLYISLTALFFSLISMLIITKKFSPQLSLRIASTTSGQHTHKSYREIFSKKYYLLIFLLAILPMFGMYYVDFVFFAQTKIAFPDKDVLASFLGLFLGFSAIVEFNLKSFVSGRLISKYGVKLGLIALPVMLIFGFTITSIAGTFLGTAALFFSFLAMSRLFMRTVRTSINDPAFQILFQPLPPNERLAFQTQIEGGPKSLGGILAGVALVLFAAIGALNLVHFSYIFLILLIVWIRIAFKMHKEYRSTLKNVLGKSKEILVTDTDRIIDNQDFWTERLLSSNPEEFRLTLNLLKKTEPLKVDDILIFLFPQVPNEIKLEILNFIDEKKVIKALGAIELCLENKDSLEIRQQLLETQKILENARQISFEKLTSLTNSNKAGERELAAGLLGQSGRYKAFQLLTVLLRDKEPKVKKTALLAAGKIKRFQLWSYIIENLSSPGYMNEAAHAIKIIGEPIIDDIEVCFSKNTTQKRVKTRIVKLYGEIGGQKAIDLLREKMSFPDEDIRIQVLRSLSKLNYQAALSETPLIKQTIQAEILNTVWIAAARLDIRLSNKSQFIQDALKYEFEQKKEDIFLLLSMIYDSGTIKLVRENIESGNKSARVYALEIIDMTVSSDIKEMFLPLFDELTLSEYVNNYKQIFPQEKLSVIERLKDIVNTDNFKINNWTKACAIELLGEYNANQVSGILSANAIHPDPFLMETSSRTLYRVNKNKYLELAGQFIRRKSKNKGKALSIITAALKEKDEKRYMFVFDKVKQLKKVDFFSVVPDSSLINLALSATDISLEKGEQIHCDELTDSYIYIIVSGKIDFIKSGQKMETLTGNYVIGEISKYNCCSGNVEFIAAEQTALIRIQKDLLYGLVSDYHLARNI